MNDTVRYYAIKAPIDQLHAPAYAFEAQKTMYAGKHIRVRDVIFLFASENEGGKGLFARGIVTHAEALPLDPSLERQTPRVSIRVTCTGRALRPLGRTELKAFKDWKDGRPESELNFKYYRQATNKVVGLTEQAAAFLQSFFEPTSAQP